jgi:membrane protein DedA with SNARE-associated domain
MGTVSHSLQFLLHHGYVVVFGWVFAEQIGVPIPSMPVLLAAGALAGSHQMSFTVSLALAALACLISDFVWYGMGRIRGHSILSLLCKISLEPDTCVRKTENMFIRQGSRALLFAKFVPGLGTVAPPMAGMIRMNPALFLFWDLCGSLIWAGAFVITGYVFSAQLETVAGYGLRLGSWLAVLLLGILAAYVGWKYFERRRMIRSLRIARITPQELNAMLEAGGNLEIVDLRGDIEFETDNSKIRGAIHMVPSELEARHHEIPRDKDIVLYCS